MADPKPVFQVENVPVALVLTWTNETFLRNFLLKSLNPVCLSLPYTFTILTVIKTCKKI